MFCSRTAVIITGASRGFGRAVACSLAREFSQTDQGRQSVFLLVARSTEGLEETKKAVANISRDLEVQCIHGDLGDLPKLPQLVTSLFNAVDPSHFTSALLVNNAGSLGDVTKWISSYSDVHEIRNNMDLNITSPYYLTSQFINKFPKARQYIVNVSSLCAVKATPSLSLYCTGKAARDMLHEVLAEEAKNARVLNYAPGPLDTDMYNDIQRNSCSDEIKQLFTEVKDTGNVLATDTSSEKLVVILKQDRYKSGVHLDYFDEIP